MPTKQEIGKFTEELMRDMNLYDCDCGNCKYWKERWDKLNSQSADKMQHRKCDDKYFKELKRTSPK